MNVRHDLSSFTLPGLMGVTWMPPITVQIDLGHDIALLHADKGRNTRA